MNRDALFYALWVKLGVWDRICYSADIYKPRLTRGIDQVIMSLALNEAREGVN